MLPKLLASIYTVGIMYSKYDTTSLHDILVQQVFWCHTKCMTSCFTSITSVTCEFLTSKKIECNFSHPSKLNVISHIQANFCYNMVVVVLLLSNQLHNIPSYSKVLFKAQILLVHLLYTTIYTHMRHWPNHTLISPNPTNQIRALEHTSELHNIPSVAGQRCLYTVQGVIGCLLQPDLSLVPHRFVGMPSGGL